MNFCGYENIGFIFNDSYSSFSALLTMTWSESVSFILSYQISTYSYLLLKTGDGIHPKAHFLLASNFLSIVSSQPSNMYYVISKLALCFHCTTGMSLWQLMCFAITVEVKQVIFWSESSFPPIPSSLLIMGYINEWLFSLVQCADCRTSPKMLILLKSECLGFLNSVIV